MQRIQKYSFPKIDFTGVLTHESNPTAWELNLKYSLWVKFNQHLWKHTDTAGLRLFIRSESLCLNLWLYGTGRGFGFFPVPKQFWIVEKGLINQRLTLSTNSYSRHFWLPKNLWLFFRIQYQRIPNKINNLKMKKKIILSKNGFDLLKPFTHFRFLYSNLYKKPETWKSTFGMNKIM